MLNEAMQSRQFAALHLLSPVGENWFESSFEDELDLASMLAAAMGMRRHSDRPNKEASGSIIPTSHHVGHYAFKT